MTNNLIQKRIKTSFSYDGYLEKCTRALWMKHCGFDSKWDPIIMTYDNMYSLDCNTSTCFEMIGQNAGEHLSAFALEVIVQ